jgi:L-fucose mutarotase
MLKHIDPLLNADLLHALQSMGHGDELALVDCNFPAASTARRLIRLDGADAIRAACAVLSVFPVDTFVEPAAFRMEVVGAPAEVPTVQRAFQAALDDAEGRAIPIGALERFAFYERARRAYAVIATGERRPYGCFLLVKGVIGANARA